MDDETALLAAACDRPDDDTPRLVLADWLDDHGDAARAAFVRAQVELARTPEWEPFAVECRHRRPEWSDAGAPFRDTLPPFPDGWTSVGWLDPPFRRGLGWRVAVGALLAWEEVARELFQKAPVGALHLRAAATLDDWRRFAAGSWLERVREVHLEAGGSPVEPVRALAAGGKLTNLEALHFHRADLPGIDLLLADVLAEPLGANLRELSFRLSSPASLDDLIDVLAANAGRFDRLALRAMNLTGELVRRWADAGGLRNLLALDLEHNYVLGADRYRALAGALAGSEWAGHTLRLAYAGVGEPGAKALAACPGVASVRLLDLSRNTLGPTAARALAASPHLAGLRALRLRNCQLGDQAVRRLVRATFWNNLTELDLRDNPVTDPGAKHFLAAPTPPDLTALVLSGRHLSRPTRAALARHFGPRVVIEEE
ncbi:TIGR02996 domain-containing protein [bacterium]|nr:TIGR02996 domain-containing protein [bacterium]